MMLRRFARKYSTCDIVEEYRSIPVCPLVDSWVVADDAWADDIGGIPCPDWTKVLASPPTVSYLASFGGFHLFAMFRMLELLSLEIIYPQC
jgi:hypothetical protein